MSALTIIILQKTKHKSFLANLWCTNSRHFWGGCLTLWKLILLIPTDCWWSIPRWLLSIHTGLKYVQLPRIEQVCFCFSSVNNHFIFGIQCLQFDEFYTKLLSSNRYLFNRFIFQFLITTLLVCWLLSIVVP